MKLKILLLFIGALVISSKSEPSRIKQQNYNSQSLPQNGSANNRSNDPRKSVPGPIGSHDGSQASSPGFGFNQGPPTRPDNSNYGSRGSFPRLKSNQGPINGQDPYHNPQDFSPTSGFDMGSDQNLPLVWQLETTEVIDRDALRNNPNVALDHFNSINFWRLQPLEDNTYSLNMRHLPKVVLLKSTVRRNYSKPSGTVRINGINMIFYSVRVVENPSIDDVRAIYNPHSSEAPIYITEDPNWPIFVGSNYGKLRSIRHVRRVYF